MFLYDNMALDDAWELGIAMRNWTADECCGSGFIGFKAGFIGFEVGFIGFETSLTLYASYLDESKC